MNEIRYKYQNIDFKGFTLGLFMIVGIIIYQLVIYLMDGKSKSWFFVFLILWFLVCIQFIPTLFAKFYESWGIFQYDSKHIVFQNMNHNRIVKVPVADIQSVECYFQTIYNFNYIVLSLYYFENGKKKHYLLHSENVEKTEKHTKSNKFWEILKEIEELRIDIRAN